MRGRGAGAVGVGVLLLASSLPFSAAAQTFGTLAVTAPDWLLVIPPAADGSLASPWAMNYSEALFQSPGDLNGDGNDDLVGWTVGLGGPGQFVGWGQPNGSVLEQACPLKCRGGFGDPEFEPYGPAGAGSELDLAPTHIDADFDGADDWLTWVGPGILSCSFYDPCPVGSFRMFFQTPPNFSYPWPAAQPPMVELPPRVQGNPTAFAYLTPPLRPGDGAAVIVEEPHPERANNGTTPAFTQFQVFYIKGRQMAGASDPWTLPEPTPLSAQPRPPRFLAAPDFDLDGLADLALWSPIAPSPTGVPAPGFLTILNGSQAGPTPSSAQEIPLEQPQAAFGDFDGDGHTDLATWGFVPAQPGISPSPFLNVNFHFWIGGNGLESRPSESLHLQGPSIFASQPPPRLQVGDIDGNGRADFVTLKYDTTSASSGHILVDVFVNPSICGPLRDCLAADEASLSYSSEITLSGTDIYTNDGGLRLNVASDYDGDGLKDITVGYYGGNAPERGRTSVSGLVAVLYGRTVVDRYAGVWIEGNSGGVLIPGDSTYTIHVQGWTTTGNSTDLRINVTGLSPGLYVDMNQTGPVVVSSAPNVMSIAPGSWANRTDGPAGTHWDIGIPFRLNWSGAPPHRVSLDAYFFWGRPGEHFQNPNAGRYDPRVEIRGPLAAESDGRMLDEGGWSRAGAPINFSNLSVVYAALPQIPVPPHFFDWLLGEGTAMALETPAGGARVSNVSTLPATARGKVYTFGIASVDILTGPAPWLAAPFNFTINLDGDLPQFGAHLPLESEWVTSTPTFAAVDIFDNESGVDPDRIEYSWENDGAPFVRWDRATALPGQTAAEVVGQALIAFPEGNLSNVIWRVWDKAGNGPAESPIFGVKVDTTGLTFQNPRPPASEWQNAQSVVANVEILSGSSGVYRSSVEYRVSTAGLFAFGPWTSAPTLSSPLDPAFVATTALSLEEGDANWVQWRADSNARVGLRLSDPFQIRVDSLRPIIVSVQPNESSIFPLGPVPLSLAAHEGSPEGVAQRGLDAVSPGGATYRIKGPADLDFGPVWPLSPTSVSTDEWSASFANGGVFERGNSTVQFTVRERGGRTVTALTTVRVNQVPTVTIESTPANFTVAVLGNLTLNARATDPEGQPLRYAWSSCTPQPSRPPAPPRPPPPFSTNASVNFSADAAEPMRTTTARTVELCLVVRDSMDGEVRTNVTVQVVVPPPPEANPPPPTAPQVTAPTADAGFAAIVLVAAAAVAALALLLRRRRAPPDNV